MREIILDSVELFLIIGSLLALLVGLVLIFKPEAIRSLNQYLDKWYSSRKKLKPFEIMRETDSYFYRHNKIWGWVMLAGSGLFLYYFLAKSLPESALQSVISNAAVAVLVSSVIRAVWLFFAVFIVAGLPVWILLIVDPEKLKKASQFFNRWLSTRLMLLPLEKMHFGVDSFVLRHNRFFGIVFVLGSVFILFTFLVFV